MNTFLTNEEHTALIYASTRDQVLSCSFGPSWVRLDPTESNKWAFDLLAQIRAPKPSDPDTEQVNK